MKTIQKPNGYRIIKAAGRSWYYWVGRTVVIARSESGKSRTVSLTEIIGLTLDQVERAKRKHVLAITPGLIRAWLEK